MKTPQQMVGVRELRTHLSAYLRAVARGATVTIGDRRRRAVARLVPVERSSDDEVDDEVLDRLAARGLVRRGTGKPRIRPRVRLRGRGRLASEIVVEDRR